MELSILWASYLSQSTIKFFLDNKLGFRIYYSFDLVQFLRRIEYIGGLPEGVSIEKIIKFRFEDGQVYKWDKDIFEEVLDRRKGRRNHISQEEYNRYIKLIK